MLQFEQQYLDALPCAHMYEKSYMHRDTVTHVVVSGNRLRQAEAAGHGQPALMADLGQADKA